MQPHRILRERLVTAADHRWSGGLTVSFGGPGMGKSTLIRQAMAESHTLGRGNEWLIRVVPDADAAALLTALHRELELRVGPSPEAIAEYLWAQAPRRVGLIIDDAHELDDSGFDLLLELGGRLPTNAHLWVSTRDRPRVVARLLAASPVLSINEDELRFDDDEVSTFARAEGLVAADLQSAGGWPAVLALSVSAGPSVTSGYLYETVLAGLSRRQQGDLAVAAALGELDPEIAGRVLEGPAADLTVIPLVDVARDGTIVVHDLWRSPTAELIDPDRRNSAVRAAAQHAERRADIDRAVSMLHGNGLTADARRVMVAHIAAGADRVPLERIERWLTLAAEPGDGLLRQTLQLVRGGLVEGTIGPDRLEALSEQCQRSGELDLEAVLAEVRFAIAWSADAADECVAIANRLIELNDAGIEHASHARATREITAARAALDNERVIALIRAARIELGDLPGLDWNLPLELETLVRLGRPIEALARLESIDERLAAAKTRSVTYALTYWFCGRADDALASLDHQLSLAGRFSGIEHSWRITSDLFRSWRGIDTRPWSPPEVANRQSSTYSLVSGRLVEVARLINDGREADAAAALGALAVDHPPTGGFALHAWFMGAAAWYVLRPDDRPMLDAFMTDGLFAEANALFRAFLEGRDGMVIGPQRIAAFPPSATIGTILPCRWACELALRLPPQAAALRDEIFTSLPGAGLPMLEVLVQSRDATADGRALAQRASTWLSAVPQPPAHLVRVHLCGPPRLDVGVASTDPSASEWRRGRVRALLGLLARDKRVTREAAIDALWPHLDQTAGRRNLRVTLTYLTKALEPQRVKSAPPWFVRSEQDSIVLNDDGLELDVLVIERCLATASTAQRHGLASQAIDSLRTACESYHGPFLIGLDDRWIEDERTVLGRRVHEASLRLSGLLLAGGLDEASVWARLATEIDPWSVRAQQALVDALPDPSPERRAAETRRRQLDEELA